MLEHRLHLPVLTPKNAQVEALARFGAKKALFIGDRLDTDIMGASRVGIDSVLVLYLRQRLTQADAQGERAVVDLSEIVDNLTLYERAASTDRAGFTKRVNASVEKIKKHNILQKIRASEDRYEISPTLKLLFSAEEIQTLTALYLRMAAGETSKQQPLSIDDDEDDA